MDHYFVAQIKITDEASYQKYLAGVDAVFEKYQGTYLSVDDNPLVLEGSWDYTRTVLIRFPSRDAFEAWYRSDAYQALLKYRLKGAHCDTILVKGYE